jgi:hypothetical protein
VGKLENSPVAVCDEVARRNSGRWLCREAYSGQLRIRTLNAGNLGSNKMNTTRTVLMFATAALLMAPAMALAQDAISAPAQKTIGQAKSKMVPSLAVLNSRGATLQNDTLTLTGVSPNSIIFADRPVRSAGHVLTSEFLKEWDVGNDSFATEAGPTALRRRENHSP